MADGRKLSAVSLSRSLLDESKKNLESPLGTVPSEFRGDLLRLWATCSGISEILHLAVLVVHGLVTNGRTDSGLLTDSR